MSQLRRISAHFPIELSLEPTIEPSSSTVEVENGFTPSLKGRLYGVGSMGSEDDGSVGDKTLSRLRALGVEKSAAVAAVRDGAPFPCVLPGHATHQANVDWWAGAGFWRYHCRDGNDSLGLAEVRASIGYGESRWISRVEAARWRERLDHEARIEPARAIPLPALPRCSEATRRVAEGFRLLMALRDERWRDGDPYTFARHFVCAWCDVTDDQARAGVKALERHGLIERVGTNGRAILWQPTIAWRTAA